MKKRLANLAFLAALSIGGFLYATGAFAAPGMLLTPGSSIHTFPDSASITTKTQVWAGDGGTSMGVLISNTGANAGRCGDSFTSATQGILIPAGSTLPVLLP